MSGETLTERIIFTQLRATIDEENRVFLKARGSFLITDDLQVMPLSAETTLDLLANHGTGAEQLELKAIGFSQEEVTLLFKHMLFTKASLTNTFLLEQREVYSKPPSEEIHEFYSVKKEEIHDVQKISLNVIVQISSQKVICAEARDDFVSFLMSMLTFPLGAVVKLLDRAPTLGSISDLYNSVEGLSVEEYMKSEHHNSQGTVTFTQACPSVCLQESVA